MSDSGATIMSLAIALGLDVTNLANGLKAAESQGKASGDAIDNAMGLKGAQKGLDSTTDLAGSLRGAFGGLLSEMVPVVTIAGMVAGGMELVKESIAAAADEQTALTQLDATLISTGRDGEISAVQIDAFSNSLSGMFDKAQINEAAAILSRDLDIPSAKIPGILSMLENYATEMGVTLPDAANVLGRALESGMTRGMGFSRELTNEISTMMSAGDIAGADALIMDQFNQKFDGQASAALMTYAGATAAVDTSMEKLKATTGKDLLTDLTIAKLAFADLIDEYVIWQEMRNGGKDTGWGAYTDTSRYAKMSTDELNDALKKQQDLLKGTTSELAKGIIGQNMLAINTELDAHANQDLEINLGGLPTYLQNLKVSSEDASTSQDLYNETLLTYWGNVNAATAYELAYNNSLKDGKNDLEAAAKAGKSAADAIDQAGEKALKAQDDWETSFTTAKTGADQTKLMFDLLGSDLQGMGATGAAVWDAFLMSSGKIDKPALEAFARIQSAMAEIQSMLDAGLSLDVIVNWIQTGALPSGTGANADFPSSWAPMPGGVLGGSSPSSPGDWTFIGNDVAGFNKGALYYDAKTGKYSIGIPGAAEGADFIVPSGYPNDSFPLRVESGEHVVVTPANSSLSGMNTPGMDRIAQQDDSAGKAGKAGQTNVINIYNPTGEPAETSIDRHMQALSYQGFLE